MVQFTRGCHARGKIKAFGCTVNSRVFIKSAEWIFALLSRDGLRCSEGSRQFTEEILGAGKCLSGLRYVPAI